MHFCAHTKIAQHACKLNCCIIGHLLLRMTYARMEPNKKQLTTFLQHIYMVPERLVFGKSLKLRCFKNVICISCYLAFPDRVQPIQEKLLDINERTKFEHEEHFPTSTHC